MSGYLFLWRSANRLDPAGFEALLRPHLDILYRTALRMTGQHSEAEDLIQELLLKLYARRRVLRTVEDLTPWLRKALYNLFIQRRRSHSRTPFSRLDVIAADVLMESIEAGDPTPDVLLAQSDDQRVLLNTLSQLSEAHRAVLVGHDVEGFTQSELGALLDLPVGTVKSRLFRARTEMRALLERGNQIEASSVLVRDGKDKSIP